MTSVSRHEIVTNCNMEGHGTSTSTIPLATILWRHDIVTNDVRGVEGTETPTTSFVFDYVTP